MYRNFTEIIFQLPSSDNAVCGKSFFISDGIPVNNFIFLKKLLDDETLFSFYIPTAVMLAIAQASEAMHLCFAPLFSFTPFLTVAEVCKVGVTHFASITAAKNCLGYEPIIPPQIAIEQTKVYCVPLMKPLWKRRCYTFFYLVLVASILAVIYLPSFSTFLCITFLCFFVFF